MSPLKNRFWRETGFGRAHTSVCSSFRRYGTAHLTFRNKMLIALFADDILLLAPSVSELQRLLCICESELKWLDLSISI